MICADTKIVLLLRTWDCQYVRSLRTIFAMTGEAVHPLRAWRLAEGYTLDAAAAGVETVRSTWFDWETGRRLPGDRETYDRIYRFTKGAITADAMIWPFGKPPIGQMALPFATPAPLLDHANATVGDRDDVSAGAEHGGADGSHQLQAAA
jgi:hypothetical protein